MTESELSKYTERQLAILRREVEPEDNDEWAYLQDHGNDLLPPKIKKPLFRVTGDDLERSKQIDRGNTQAGHIGEALDKKEANP